MVREVVFMFEIHQPIRLRPYNVNCLSDYIKHGLKDVYDWQLNEEVFKRALTKCYLPALEIILNSIKAEIFKVTFSISGVWLEQAFRYNSKVIDLIQKIVETGNAELVAQTYYHSISPLLSDLEEFVEQVKEDREVVEEVFGLKPKVAEATEFIYNNNLGSLFWKMGFKACVTEGVDRILMWRNPNYVYSAYGCDLRLLLRNYKLSDDVAFRFSNPLWDQYPLTADKYADWIAKSPGDLVFIAMDFETFGEHQWPETGILEFLRWLPRELRIRGVEALTISEVIERHEPVDVYDIPPWDTISWADVEKNVSAWLSSEFQVKALQIYEELGMYAKAIGNPYLKHWRYFGISDSFYYMSTKGGSSGEVHIYFSPFKKGLEAYTSYLSLLMLLYSEVMKEYLDNIEKHSWNIRTTPKCSFKFKQGEKVVVEARSLSEVLRILKSTNEDITKTHILRGDLQRWIREVILWEELAKTIDEAVKTSPESCVKEIIKIIEETTPKEQ
ncbi:MAG: glycoside hydrolase family 57 protein [Candidatus Nezhaarchaeales archaeon]